ncbi:hypothetical protein ACQP2F_11130 [Actinoplanes sp. CA-030573]|uniref:hypothetical protein n=1 Tax=Actinoplanes sp. CA-030573 TaxID=3239898 RepID=UPI003D94FE66
MTSRLCALAAAAIAVVMLIVYVGLIRGEGDEPAMWFVAGLAAAVLLAVVGAIRPGRPALTASGVLLVGLGLAGILTIGLPILAAGGLALTASYAAR